MIIQYFPSGINKKKIFSHFIKQTDFKEDILYHQVWVWLSVTSLIENVQLLTTQVGVSTYEWRIDGQCLLQSTAEAGRLIYPAHLGGHAHLWF